MIAGKWNPALMALYPEAVKKERCLIPGEWFCNTAVDASVENGHLLLGKMLDNLDRLILKP